MARIDRNARPSRMTAADHKRARRNLDAYNARMARARTIAAVRKAITIFAALAVVAIIALKVLA